MVTPSPTTRMSMETANAAETEKAIPRWAEASEQPSASDEPRNRLKPREVVPIRPITVFELPWRHERKKFWAAEGFDPQQLSQKAMLHLDLCHVSRSECLLKFERKCFYSPCACRTAKSS